MLGDDGDLIPPAAFLDIAERFGLIQADRPLGRPPGDRAAAPSTRRGPPAQPARSTSPARSLGDRELLELIERELAATPASTRPRSIFEITETAAIANIERARALRRARCAALGCRFALDDFGAGFGSFYYLKHLPFDYLKIDGEFVAHLPRARTDQLVVEAMVEHRARPGQADRSPSSSTDEETLDLPGRTGVDYAQGFHIGRPVPVEDSLIPAALG